MWSADHRQGHRRRQGTAIAMTFLARTPDLSIRGNADTAATTVR
jgi:hypothetical protein